MFIRWILPIAAALGFLMAVRIVIVGSKPVLPPPPVSAPSTSPFPLFVAGVGIVEPNSENIQISTNIAGVVSNLYVSAGDTVKSGEPLFKIDDRQYVADLHSAEAALAVAESVAADAKNELVTRERIADRRAISADELNRKRYASAIADGRVKQAQAQLDEARITLERLTVRAPIDGVILQVKLRSGEYAQAGALSTPYMVMGSTTPLNLRIDVDENDAWRVRANAPAEGYLRGNPQLHSSLTFVRFEPFVVPKRSLTGESSEKVDTRVLQVIYSIQSDSLPVFVGQLMDVYIEAQKE